MKRNQHGINLDEGIALVDEEEFKLLYIESACACERDLSTWISEGKRAVLFGGQIGFGKTTAIKQAFRLSETTPDIEFHFDRNDLNLSPLDAWIIVFSEIARFSSGEYFSILVAGFPGFAEVFGTRQDELNEVVADVLLETFSLAALGKHRRLKALLEPLLEHLPHLFQSVVEAIEKKLGRSLVLLAAGVDKFEPGSPAYVGLSDTLTSLAGFKTLFEVNAVHLFINDGWAKQLEKIVLTASNQSWIEEMLRKRLGVYQQSYCHEIPVLAAFSGGIPRQAIRLLDYFISQQKTKMSQQAVLKYAVESVNRDFFAYSKRPEDELLNIILKKQVFETSWVALPGDSETALCAVFENWIILQQQKHESQWHTVVNPIIKYSFKSTVSDEPEMKLLKDYAAQQGMGVSGLDINTEINGWKQSLLSAVELPVALNITEILDVISNALLSKQRTDRIIVAYENKDNFDAVYAYLQAKSNTYEYQVWRHVSIEGGANRSPLTEMLAFFTDQSIDIYSVELVGDFTVEQLAELNVRRDNFIDKQLIWWIPKPKLASYLIHWTQLRQLFKVFILEDDLSKTLKAEDIEADLNFMEDLVESEDTAAYSYVSNLKQVLTYIKYSRHGE